MARTERGIHRRYALAAVVVCLTGCQNPGRPPQATSILGTGQTEAITSGQEADAQIALGRAAEQRGEFDQAMLAYRSGLERDKTRVDVYHRLAVLHDKQGKFREADELYRQALEASPGNPDLFCDKGYSLYLQRRWSEAEMNLMQALALDRNHPRAHNNLGMVLAHIGRVGEALEEFHKAGCDEFQARENIAFALTTERRWDEARVQYQLAQKSRPGSKTSGDRLKQLEILAAKVDGAKRPDAPVDPALLAASGTRPMSTAAPTDPSPVHAPARMTTWTAPTSSVPPTTARPITRRRTERRIALPALPPVPRADAFQVPSAASPK